ncbi:MAG: pantetheine-phosphate adenylyltransferase [Candidatus Omnitrophica bacterium]|nr:pantetheine-phosphate adenylyltransferase [Candidatus Omnitrophota bacterium]
MPKRALYPGTFDPITLGHLDVINRAAEVFDEVVVGVANNPRKKTLFSKEERVAMIREVVKENKRIKVVDFEGLVINFAKQNGLSVLIRGLRAVSDFEYELQMVLTNRKLAEDIETVFLMPSQNYLFLASTTVKEAASLGADVSSFVPDVVEKYLKEKFKKS